MNLRFLLAIFVMFCLQQYTEQCDEEMSTSQELLETLNKISKNMLDLTKKLKNDKIRQEHDKMLLAKHKKELESLKKRLEKEKNQHFNQQIIINQHAGVDGNNNAVITLGDTVPSRKQVEQKIDLQQQAGNSGNTIKSTLNSESKIDTGKDGKTNVNVTNKQKTDVTLNNAKNVQSNINQDSDATILSENDTGNDTKEISIKHEVLKVKDKLEMLLRKHKIVF